VNVNAIVRLDPGTATPSQGDGLRLAARITIQTQDGLRTGETVLPYPGSMIVDEQAVKTR
jgi:hypothetical protein